MDNGNEIIKKTYDPSDPLSIFQFSEGLINRTLKEVAPLLNPEIDVEDINWDGKGGLGVLVEKYYFGKEPNNSILPDFNEAGLELKVTPLKKDARGNHAIKERLVCDMIDFMSIINEDFENSRFCRKSLLMLIIFYLHVKGVSRKDLRFIYSILWTIKNKDYLIIRNDFLIIREKVRQGKAHELSEGDTMYLAACRKGHKGDSLRRQPNSDVLAKARAFSLKPAYMRTVLEYIRNSGKNWLSNIHDSEFQDEQLVEVKDLEKKTFDQIVIDKILQYKGLNSDQIIEKLGGVATAAKNKNEIALRYIFKVRSLEKAEEIKKSGIIVKTIRIKKTGVIQESMSFSNIDYNEINETTDWTDSTWYEIVTSRFLFVIFRETDDNGYVLDRCCFWTMPSEDLTVAEEYWLNIRQNVLDDTLQDKDTTNDPNKINKYWKVKDHRNFHVRPKAQTSADKYYSPISGDEVPRKSYWFNRDYILEIVKKSYGEDWNKLF